jgi:hypothetical protein
LSVGTTYYVRASAPAGTTYWSFCHQQQDPFDAAPDWGSSLLKGGMVGVGANGLGGGGEVTTNGSTWVDTYAFAPVDHGMYLANV